MKPFQERVFIEQKDLSIKLEKLRKFIFDRGEMFKALPYDEQLRLEMQEKIMSVYLFILAQRIANFVA